MRLLTACAGFAQAQSSVTVYGIIDAGYVGSNAKEVAEQILCLPIYPDLTESQVNRICDVMDPTADTF